MTPCDYAAIVIGVLVLVGIAFTVPDVLKYLKLKNM
jgi:hypothetical protein